MNEPNGMLLALGFFMIFGGLIWACIGSFQTKIRIVIIGFLVMTLGAVIFLHIFWGAWWLFLRNLASSIPTWVWIAAGIALYFNLNYIYLSWLDYAHEHPGGLAGKILGPPPIGLPDKTEDIGTLIVFRIGGILFLYFCWLATLIWLVFGGAAKLLHLVPRE